MFDFSKYEQYQDDANGATGLRLVSSEMQGEATLVRFSNGRNAQVIWRHDPTKQKAYRLTVIRGELWATDTYPA